jgi:signal transduction histidine kinase
VEYVHSVNTVSQLARRHGFDALIVLAALASTLGVAFRQDDPDAPTTPLWFSVPASAVIVLPLLARRRYPFRAPAFVWLLGPALSFVDGRIIPFAPALTAAGLAAAFLLGNLRNAAEAWLGLAIVLGGTAIIVYNGPNHSPAEFFFIPLFFAIGWLAGYALRERAEEAEAAEERALEAERAREAAARVAVAEERARIARELHDIVAHAVSVMVLQVGAVRHKLPDELGEDRDALMGVERAGRVALAEMRRLLAAMSGGENDADLSPQPGLDRLASLAEEVGRAGLPVRVHVDGEPSPLPQAIELSAYRIVQEGLTNALKHAHAANADVTVRYGRDELDIEVRDDGRGAAVSDGLGHGLVGIRERVKIYGGEMSAGTANGGGFVLSARLPLGGDRP